MVSKALEAFEALSEFDLDVSDWVPGWDRLKVAISKVVTEMAALVGGLIGELGLEVKDFANIQEVAKTFASIIAPIKNALDAFASLAKIEEIPDVTEKFRLVIDELGKFTDLLNKAADDTDGWIVPLTKLSQSFIGSLGNLLNIVKAANSLRNALEKWTDEVKGKIVARVDVLVQVLGIVTERLNAATEEVGGWLTPLTKLSQDFLASLGRVVSIVSSVAGLREKLEEWTDEIKGKVIGRIDVLVQILGIITERLNLAANDVDGWLQPLSELAKGFLASLSGVVAILNPVIGFRNALAEWTDEVKNKIPARVDVLIQSLGIITERFNLAVDQIDGWLMPLGKAAQLFKDSLGNVVDILQTAHGFRNALEEWTDEVKDKIVGRVDVLISTLGIVAERFNLAVDEVDGWIVPLSDLAKIFIDSLGSIVSVLQSTNAFRNGLEKWTDELKGKVQGRVEVLVAVLGIIARELTTKMNEGALPEITKALKEFTERVVPLIAALQSGIGFFADLAELVIPRDYINRTKMLTVALTDMIEAILDVGDFPGMEEGEIDSTVVELTQFVDRVKPMVDIIGNAISIFASLATDFVIPRDFIARTKMLTVALTDMIEAMLDVGDFPGIKEGEIDSTVVEFQQFLDRIRPLVDIINGAVSVIKSLAENIEFRNPEVYTSIIANLVLSIASIIEDVDRFLPAIVTAIDKSGNVIDKVRDKLQLWADRLQPLSSVLSSTISIFKALAEDVELRNPRVFTSIIANLMLSIVSIIKDMDQFLPTITLGEKEIDKIVEKLSLWAARIQQMAAIITSGVSALKALREFKPGNLRFLTEFVDELVRVVEEMDKKLKGKVSKELKDVGERISALFGGILVAVQGLVALRGFRSLLPVWLTRFINDLVLVLEEISKITVPQGVVDKVAEVEAAIAPVLGIVQSLISLRGYRSLLPEWIARFATDIEAVLGALADVGGFKQGFMLGEAFARGFLAALEGGITTGIDPIFGGVPSSIDPIIGGGINSGGTTFFNYGTMNVTTEASDGGALVGDLQLAMRQN